MSSNRLSRAAIFAGAIAAPACWRGSDPVTSAQPPITQASTDAQSAAGAGVVTGIVTDLYTRGPALRVHVTLRAPDGTSRYTLTDETGRYTFRDLVPGNYTLEWYSNAAARHAQQPVAPTKKPIVVEAGQIAEANLAVTRPPEMPLATPYGAPPARVRRV